MHLKDDALARLEELTGGDEAILAELFASFLLEFDTLNAVLDSPQPVAAEDVRLAAHTLSSNLETFGVPDVAMLMRRVAKALAEDGNADVSALIQAYRARCGAVRVAIAERTEDRTWKKPASTQ